MHQPKPHVILIAYIFRPSTEMGAIRPSRFRKNLQRMGYACHTITATPQGDNPADDIIVVPDDLRARWEGTERSPLSYKGYLELLIRHVMYPGHLGFIWSKGAAAECLKLFKKYPNDRFVVLATYPPMGTLVAGLMVRLRKRVPWIADFRDPIFGVPKELLPFKARFWNRVIEERTFRQADAVIANVETAYLAWREQYPWVREKLHLIYNGFDPVEAPRPLPIPPRDHKLIVHAGALYHGRNPNVVIESLSRLRNAGKPEAQSVRIMLVGVVDAKAGLNQALCDQAQREGWLELQPTASWDEWERIVGEADGLLLAQPQSSLQTPGKLYAYVCVGRPVLALVPKSSAVEHLLVNAGVPHVCLYVDDPPQTVDEKLLKFLQFPNTATPINDWFQTNFNAERQAEKLASIIDEIAR